MRTSVQFRSLGRTAFECVQHNDDRRQKKEKCVRLRVDLTWNRIIITHNSNVFRVLAEKSRERGFLSRVNRSQSSVQLETQTKPEEEN